MLRLFSCWGFCLDLGLLGSLRLLNDNALGELLLLALAHSNGVDPGFHAVDAELAVLVASPPSTAGVEGDELDLTLKAESFL